MTGADGNIWLAEFIGNKVAQFVPGTAVAASGDFNGDGVTDILWQNAAGITSEWLMSPSGGIAGMPFTPAAPGWNVIASGDFNGDHTADLLWQHASTGMTAEWLMAPTGGVGSFSARRRRRDGI